MDNRRKFPRNDDRNEDVPMYSRLFIVCDRSLKEEDLKEVFEQYGYIEDVRMPCDHKTGERKGVAYIKFSKTSEAAYALEAMHNKQLPNTNRPLKVMVAANRSEIHSEDNDKYRRLFINVFTDVTEDSLNDYFKEFGNVEDILLLRDRNTGEKKGYAYVKFRKFSQAAVAIENCDKKYRAIFAQPKGHNKRSETAFETNINTLATSTANHKNSLISMMNVNPRGFTRVNYICNPYLTHPHVEAIFDIVPGMVECRFFVDLMRNIGKGSVQYSNQVSAAYAVEKLNELEYPPGHKLFVRPANGASDDSNLNIPKAVQNLRKAITATTNCSSPDIAELAEAIAEASKLIKVATGGVCDDNIPDSNDLNYCSVKLPPTQPLADIDAHVEKRCFLVCKPQPPPLQVLRDIFCRFGNLVNVYTLPNKTVGYARYAKAESADEAMKTLHGAEVCGVRMKVLEAEDEAPAKRMKLDY